MCGRYAASAHPEDLVEELDIDVDQTSAGPEPLRPRFNLAPTDPGPVVLERAPRGEPDAPPQRQLRLLRWGLVPSWSKDAKGAARMINARSESLFETAAYRRTALVRRCLVPADGWYEWQASPSARDAKGKPRKQPFFVHLAAAAADHAPPAPLVFAGLYEFWRDKGKPDDDPDAWLVTYTIITTAAESGLDRIHDRMPFVLDRERWADWLDPAIQDPDAVRALLEPPPPGRFAAYPVTSRVNSVRNDGPELLEPAAPEDLVGVVDPMTGEVIG